MSEFDRENEDVFQIVHDNPRRRGIIRDVGYVVNRDVAERFAAYEAAQSRNGSGIGSLILLAACLLVTVTVTALALV